MTTTKDSIFDTPWGRAQHCTQLADGILSYSTASHGGLWISDQRRAEMPEPYKSIPTFAGGNWYEEDCDWCLVLLAWPEINPDLAQEAKATFEWLKTHSDRFQHLREPVTAESEAA